MSELFGILLRLAGKTELVYSIFLSVPPFSCVAHAGNRCIERCLCSDARHMYQFLLGYTAPQLGRSRSLSIAEPFF
jgi:hypothetical protein